MNGVGTLPSQLATIDWLGSGVRARKALEADGPSVFRAAWDRIDTSERREDTEFADMLTADGISLVTIFDREYPASLRDLGAPPPYLFTRGNREMLDTPGLGVCGSRDASVRGLTATKACAQRAVDAGRSVISGYARGVDTEGHCGALAAGGGTVIVLPEGISGFRIKRSLSEVFDWGRVLVVSQFAPRQKWSAGNAMARNGTIVALSDAVLVVEARERGGTLNAGRQGLAIGRRVAAIGLSDDTPPGNRSLIAEGAKLVETPAQFEDFLAVEDKTGPPTMFEV
ncbi:MAG: DNA-processing protein DprA [Actinobacteria bacterium]|nr:DNA-processing protein DprA [Actinomycetota bacterium]